MTSQCAGTANSAGQALAVERPELTGLQPERLRLDGHVGHGLAEVVERELRVVPVGVLDVAVREVGDEHARGRRPRRRAPGEVADQPAVHADRPGDPR